MIIKKVIDFEMDQNCYIVYKEDSQKCIVIDPGNSYDKLIRELDKNNLSVSDILLTHCHYDHMSEAEKLKNFTGALVSASKRCAENIKNPRLNVSVMFGENLSGDYIDNIVSEKEEFEAAGMMVKCIETPGHTDCSVCYLIENSLFSGDTLFLRTTGRWDLPTGNYDELVKSLQDKLYLLDDGIKVYPGHGNSTSIGYEKNFNMSIAKK